MRTYIAPPVSPPPCRSLPGSAFADTAVLQGPSELRENSICESLDKPRSVRAYLRLVDTYLQAGLDALADSTRMAIFQKLTGGPLAVNELARLLPVTRPAVSQHLKVLKDAGLVMDQKAGTRRLYQVDPEGVARLRAHFDQMWTRALSAFQKVAEESPNGENRDRHRRTRPKGSKGRPSEGAD
ncbi:MAG TPA: metalloregulator ArsR/SmtB family transcription factor [Acidobacteriaceae bacterium]|nr:metalloregulator ArsR/SmtB family transcription factor [Acidobacteriaceae bacterium]